MASFEQLAVLSSGVTPLTQAKYGQSLRGELQVEGGTIRFTLDGTTPSATVGFKAEDGQTLELINLQDMILFKAIAISTASQINVYYD